METQTLQLHNTFFDAVHELGIRHEGHETSAAIRRTIVADILDLLDNGTDAIPPMQLVSDPHPEDEDYLRGQGEKWWATDVVIGASRLRPTLEGLQQMREKGQVPDALIRARDDSVRALDGEEMLQLVTSQFLDMVDFKPLVWYTDDGYSITHSLFSCIQGSASTPYMRLIVRPDTLDDPRYAPWRQFGDEGVFGMVKEDYCSYRWRVHQK